MANILGLHIGITSIGWTLLDGTSNSIKAMGVHAYPNGSKNFDSGKREVSRRTQRRMQRIIRVRHARKRMRKIHLLRVLSQHQMCPVDKVALAAWKNSKSFPQKQLKTWLAINPYALRLKALEEPVSLMELGRILYHVSQRRGFPLSERSIESTGNMLFKGYPAANRLGISATEPHLDNQYLGQYLTQLFPLPHQSYTKPKERIRNRILPRSAYQKELHAIWGYQKQFHSTLTESLKLELIGGQKNGLEVQGVVFYQRPLKSQKHRVGHCIYEPQKTKCCVSALTYQQLLAYKWTNTILKDGSQLNEMERERVARYFLSHRKFGFKDIIQILDAPESVYNKKPEELITGSFVFSELSKLHYFGSQFFQYDEKTQEDIWHVLFFFKDKKKVSKYAELHWGFTAIQAQSLAKINIDKRYAPISRKAARNILFFLKRGVTYDLAVVLAGVKNSLSKVWDQIAESDICFIISRVIELYHNHQESGFINQLQDFLIEYLQLDPFQRSKLYGKAARLPETNTMSQFDFSKSADDEVYRFHSPPLIHSIFQCRKVINAIVAQHGPIDELKIQLNPKLKQNKYQRYFNKLDAKRLSSNRDQYIQIIGSLSENVTVANVLKYELWEECKHTCPYTGEPIPLEKLFTNEFRIVYIQPWSRSLNDSNLNKTLCVGRLHEKLKDMTPYEYFMEYRAYEWPDVVERAAKLFSNTKAFPSSFNKFRSFIKRHYRRNIIKLHVQDTSFLSQELRCFFTQICPQVFVAPSYSTSPLMAQWRLEKIIPAEDVSKDLRVAALYAYVAAVRNDEIVEALTFFDRYRVSPKFQFPVPNAKFRDEVEYHLNSICTSYAPNKKIISHRKLSSYGYSGKHLGVAVRGTLHKETIYAKRKAPGESQFSYHIRKPIESFQTKVQVGKIVDPVIKQCIEKAIAKGGGYINEKVPIQALIDRDYKGMKYSKVFIANKKGGDPVPIRNVRIKEKFNSAVQLKAGINRYVHPRNNHHILIYLDSKGAYKESVVSFWEAVRRKSNNEPLYQFPEPDATYITTLHNNDLFLLGIDDLAINLKEESRSFLANKLYRVQKISSKFYEFRLAYHKDLSVLKDPEFVRITNFGERGTGWLTLNPIKVKVTAAGEISRDKKIELSFKKNPSMLL